MIAIEPAIGAREVREIHVPGVVKAAWSAIRSGAGCVVLGGTVVLAYWWLLLPAVCWLVTRAALRATREIRAQQRQA